MTDISSPIPDEELQTMNEDCLHAYTQVASALGRIHKDHGLALALEMAHGTLKGAVDWAHLNVGPTAAHDLVQQVANEKWRQMIQGKKNRSAA